MKNLKSERMKSWNFTLCNAFTPKLTRKILPYVFFLAGLAVFTGRDLQAQCPVGYNQVTLNWDYLDYFTYSDKYVSGEGYLPNASWAYTQNFSFGASNRLTISVDNNITLNGEDATHTGDALSYGTGEDVAYVTVDGTARDITLSFENEVRNVQFSLYDIDNGQFVTINAANASAVSQTVALTKANGASAITFAGANPGLSPQAQGPGGNYSVAANGGTINVDISGPVKTVTIRLSNAAGDIWLSDISACDTGSFPANYFNISQPFTGQPGYVLHAFNKDVYALDPATGITKYIFTDPTVVGSGGSNRCYINSMGYDPYNHILYYVFSLSNDPGNNRQLKKYDFNTGTYSVLLADVTSIGIPVVTQTSGFSTRGRGVESGAGAFYNGAFYLGIETVNRSSGGILGTSNRENVIYRIDFDGTGTPYRASQVFALPCDNGSGTLINDWADFTIYNGELINFDGAGQTTNTNVYHFDMMTGACTDYPLPAFTPGQPTVDWTGNAYQIWASGGANPPRVAPYNMDGTIGVETFLTSTPMFTPASPSLGDAAEAFRPQGDFGDAPASYDPDPLAPANHEFNPNLRLGASINTEWNLSSSALADAEGAEENSIGAAPILNYDATLTYTVNNISVFNNTGADATLAAWLDYDFNGVFDPGEGVTLTIPTSGSQQFVNLSWNNIWVLPTTNLRTFIRFRITSAANGMTAATGMTGWFADGEVEDFEVVLGTALPKDMQSFNVAKQPNATVNVKWDINVTEPVKDFEILRSTDNNNWVKIGTVSAKAGTGLQQYVYADENPYTNGTSYYRIHINYQAESANKFTEVKSVRFDKADAFVKVLPNPAVNYADIQVNAAEKGDAVIQAYDNFGRTVLNLHKQVEAGLNKIRVDNLSTWSAGTYTLRVVVNGKVQVSQLVINKK